MKRYGIWFFFLLLFSFKTFANTSPAIQASVDETKTLTLRLMIYSTILSSKVGGIATVSPDIQESYQDIRGQVLRMYPAYVAYKLAPKAGEALLNGTKKSFDSYINSAEDMVNFNKSIGQLNRVVHAAGFMMRGSLNVSEAIIQLLRLDQLVFASSLGVRWTYQRILTPFFNFFVEINSGETLGSLPQVASTLASVYSANVKTAEASLTSGIARSILGYNAEIKRRIDKTVRDLTLVFDLKPSESAKFKEALYNEITFQAVRNEFRSDAKYDINILALLVSSGAVSQEQGRAAQALKNLVDAGNAPEQGLSVNTDSFEQCISGTLAAAAVLENVAASNEIPNELKTEAAGLITQTYMALQRIKGNLEIEQAKQNKK